MIRKSILILAAIMICLFASRAHAQGTATWSSGYPKAGTMQGTMIVQGTTTASCGYSFSGTGTVYYWPGGGGIQQSTSITVNTMTGNWGPLTISGLTSGTSYNVVVQVNLQMGSTNVTVSTDPTIVQAP
jgi:hypothetical protein